MAGGRRSSYPRGGGSKGVCLLAKQQVQIELLTEMILALEDFGIAKITQLANKIYAEGSFPTEMCKFIFITLPKKPATIKCDQQYRTPSV